MAIKSTVNKPGWKARGDFLAVDATQSSPYIPRVKHILGMIPFLIRCLVHMIVSWFRSRPLAINAFSGLQHKPYNGVPCGGMGCGGIGRDFRGGFNKYSLIPGIVEHHVDSIKANQFILSARRATDGKCVYQKVLTCVKHRSSPLSTWDCSFPAQDYFYTGLYPRSWTEYEVRELNIKLTCVQMSPMIPHDYKNSCLPVCSFVWIVENNSTDDYRLSIAFTFRNGTGNRAYESEIYCRSSEFSADGCLGAKLQHTIKGFNVAYAIALKTETDVEFSMTDFDPTGNGAEIWETLKSKGNFDDQHRIRSNEQLGISICAQFLSTKNSTNKDVEFALVWDMAKVHFGGAQRQYTRRFARYFTDAAKRAEQLCEYTFRSRPEWETAIDRWQNRIIEDDHLPDWYKSAIFNELYYLTDGGTCWMEFDDEWRQSEKQMSDETVAQFREFGRFAYLESWEYFMFNTYDVHFFASFALLENWPEVELSMQLDFGDQVLAIDDRKKVNLLQGTFTPIKKFGRVPHDLGNPADEPWLNVNAYRFSDTAEWKDLNMKFVLTCYRDYEVIVKPKNISDDEKRNILRRLYKLSAIIITHSREWDVDGDGIIENSGRPDQTFDLWAMHGTTSYCGSLWLGALESIRRMAAELGETAEAEEYGRMLDTARGAFEKKLWNGRYFDLDERSVAHQCSLTAQLAGFWFLSMTKGFNDDRVCDTEKVCSALDTIFEQNVMKLANGKMGPVNAVTPSGEVDLSASQSEEIWGGIAYSLAAYNILMDRSKQGFKTAEGYYHNCWEHLGLQYQPPEAVSPYGKYRAIGYMRPLTAWAVQRALDLKNAETTISLEPETNAF